MCSATCLQEALTLLAFENPHESPSKHVFDQAARNRCAAAANAAMLGAKDTLKAGPLELLCGHVGAIHQELRREECIEASVFDVQDLWTVPSANDDTSMQNAE